MDLPVGLLAPRAAVYRQSTLTAPAEGQRHALRRLFTKSAQLCETSGWQSLVTLGGNVVQNEVSRLAAIQQQVHAQRFQAQGFLHQWRKDGFKADLGTVGYNVSQLR